MDDLMTVKRPNPEVISGKLGAVKTEDMENLRMQGSRWQRCSAMRKYCTKLWTVEGRPFWFRNFVRTFYADLGQVIARYPILFLLIPVLMTMASAISIYLNRDLTDIENGKDLYLFMADSAESCKNMRFLKKTFEPVKASTIDQVDFHFLRHSLVYAIFVDRTSNQNAASEIGLRYAADFVEQVKKIEIQVYGSHRIQWSSLCYRTETGGCLEHPLFTALEEATAGGQVMSVAEPYLFYPVANVRNSTKTTTVDNTMILGGVSRRADNSVAKVEALRIPFVLKDLRTEMDYALNSAWRKRFLQVVKKSYYPGFRIYANTWLSLANEIQRNGNMLTPYLFYLILILITASVLGCCTADCQASKPWLGFCGLLNASFAVITATGILFCCRYSYLHMVVIMPFLVMSVSVDNVFLMLNSWRAKASADLKLEQRVSACVADTAVSIMISALTDGLSFAVGNITPFPAVQIFCTYCALALTFAFLYQMTFFVACLVLDGRREFAKRHCLFLVDTGSSCFGGKFSSPLLGQICCISRPNECCLNWMWCFNFNKWNQIFATYFAEVLNKRPTRIFTVVLYVMYLSGAIFGTVNMKFGLNITNLMPYDSPVSKTTAINERYFSAYCGHASVVINEPLDIGQEMTIKRLLSLYHSLAYSKYSSEGSFWLNEFVSFMHNRNRSLNANRYYASFLHEFFKMPAYQGFAKDVKLDVGSLSVIRYMKMTIRLRHCGQNNHTKIATMLRRRLSESSVQGFIFEPLFLIVDQNQLVLRTAMQDVVVAVVIMMAIVLMFIPKLYCTLWIGASILSINIGVIGYLALWGVELDLVSMISTVMSVGLSVDYIAHVTYHYVLATDVRKEKRISNAFEQVGLPTIQSGLLTVSGVSVLLFVRSYMVETFVKTVSLVVLLGIVHCLVFLPVALSSFVHGSGTGDELRSASRSETTFTKTSANSTMTGSGQETRRSYTRRKKPEFVRKDGKIAARPPCAGRSSLKATQQNSSSTFNGFSSPTGSACSDIRTLDFCCFGAGKSARCRPVPEQLMKRIDILNWQRKSLPYRRQRRLATSLEPVVARSLSLRLPSTQRSFDVRFGIRNSRRILKTRNRRRTAAVETHNQKLQMVINGNLSSRTALRRSLTSPQRFPSTPRTANADRDETGFTGHL